jgi:division/cell wall cluster transcriptional repressor MraZ
MVNKEQDNLNAEELFFCGEFEHVLDAQSRVAIPSEWRRHAGETRLILFPGRDKDLLLLPFEAFRDFLTKARKVAFASRNMQEALARIGAKVRDCHCDKQGRIKLEREMLDKIGVTDQLKLIGAFTHIKLCAPQQWQAGPEQDDVYLDEFQKLLGDDAGDMMRMLLENLGSKDK